MRHWLSQRETTLKCNALSLAEPIHRKWDKSLRWRHNDHDGVSNHQPRGCLLNSLFGRRSNKTSKLRVTGLCAGNSPGQVNSPHKGPVTRKMLPLDDVIMSTRQPLHGLLWLCPVILSSHPHLIWRSDAGRLTFEWVAVTWLNNWVREWNSQ